MLVVFFRELWYGAWKNSASNGRLTIASPQVQEHAELHRMRDD